MLQIQAELGFGHEHVIKAYDAILTPTHLCLVSHGGGGGLPLLHSGGQESRECQRITKAFKRSILYSTPTVWGGRLLSEQGKEMSGQGPLQ